MHAVILAVALAVTCPQPAAPHGPPTTTADAERLAHEAVIVDTHIDAPTQLMERWADLGAAQDREFDYPKARAGGLDVAFMSIYTSPGQDADDSAWNVANRMIDAVDSLALRHPDKFAVLGSPRDVERLRQGGRVLLPMGMENGAPLGDDLSKVRFFFDRGVRYVTLAHSASNRIADSSYSPERRWNGLSPFGREVVAEMNRLGMMVDVSHLSDAAVAQVLALSRAPVVATHSAFRHFTPGFERNLSDELAVAIAAQGGVIQVPFGNAFVDPCSAVRTQGFFTALAAFERDRAAGRTSMTEAEFEAQWDRDNPPLHVAMDAVLDQIDHGVRLVGVDHVGIGSDFDGVDGALPEGLESVATFPRLITGLQARGYSDADIRKILGGNLLRTWRAIEDAATLSR